MAWDSPASGARLPYEESSDYLSDGSYDVNPADTKWQNLKILAWNIIERVNWYFLVAAVILTLALTVATAVYVTENINQYLNEPIPFHPMAHTNGVSNVPSLSC